MIAVALVALFGVLWTIGRRRANRSERRRRLVVAQLPDALDILVAGLRAGLPLTAAMRLVADHAPSEPAAAFSHVLRDIADGDTVRHALIRLHDHLGSASAPLVSTLADAHRLGVPIEVLVDRLALDARLARRRASERSARELPVRLTLPLVVCVLPSFVSIVIVPAVIGTLTDLDLRL